MTILETFPKRRGRPRVTRQSFDETMPGVIRGKSRRTLVNTFYLVRAMRALAATDCPHLKDIDHNRRLHLMYELGRVESDSQIVALAKHIENTWPTTEDGIALIRAFRLQGSNQ